MTNKVILTIVVIVTLICISWSFNLQDCVLSKFQTIGAKVDCKF